MARPSNPKELNWPVSEQRIARLSRYAAYLFGCHRQMARIRFFAEPCIDTDALANCLVGIDEIVIQRPIVIVALSDEGLRKK